jgi:(E)-4-hydroxy-3-methylbut-2-enyl-diphosphate synthase
MPIGGVKSAVGIGTLLAEGIGDTIRVSLTDDPVEEVKVGIEILKSLGLRKKGLDLVACPSCGRAEVDVLGLTRQVNEALLAKGITVPIRVAVMGCVVNGPGESKHADIGISLPGTFEEPVAPVFVDGKLDRTLRGDGLVAEFIALLEAYVERRYGAGGDQAHHPESPERVPAS